MEKEFPIGAIVNVTCSTQYFYQVCSYTKNFVKLKQVFHSSNSPTSVLNIPMDMLSFADLSNIDPRDIVRWRKSLKRNLM